MQIEEWTDNDIDFIINNYNELGSIECAKILNKDLSRFRSKIQRLRKRGLCLKVDKKTISKIRQNKYRDPYKCNVNPINFINPSSPEISYILGFLWADGFLGSNNWSINTEIVTSDANILQDIFLSTGKWSFFHRKRENYKPQTKIMCYSRLLYEHLTSMDFIKNRTCPIKLINTIPLDLQHYWFRGYCDGDGSFGKNKKSRKLTFCGNINQNWEFINILTNILNIPNYKSNKIIKTTQKNTINEYSICVCYNKMGIKTFGEYIYQGKQFGLTRKYEKYLSIVS